MTNMELALTNLGETTAVEIHNKGNTIGIKPLKEDVKDAGGIMHLAKEEIKSKLEIPIIVQENYIDLTSKKEALKQDRDMI